jgi:hypothetical protein
MVRHLRLQDISQTRADTGRPRVIKWIGTVPAVAVCTKCQRPFRVPKAHSWALALSAGRSGIRQRSGSLIAHLSTARAAQFLVDRLAAIKVYRCRDCGREVGFRSRARTFMECYILPLFLMQPIRCAACFRRDYWSIITRVRKRSHYDPDGPDHATPHTA